MYEDEPQDRVHDFLADAVFGDHPLGRRVLGDAEVIASIPIPDIEAYHQARYTGANVVVGAAGHLDHERIVELGERLVSPGAGANGVTGGEQAGGGGAAALLREGHRAVPHLLRSAGDRARRRAPLRARRARLDLRRLDLLAALPRGPREARPRLLGRLLQRAVHGLRPGRDLRRHPRGQRRGGLRDHRRRARAAAHRAGLDRGARPRQGERQGPPRALLRVDRGADDADLARDALRPADRQPRRDARQGRRGRGRRPDRARRRALRRRAALGRLRRARRGLLPRCAGAGQRDPGRVRDPGRRLGRRRAHGAGRLRGGRGRRGHGADRAGPTRRSGSSSPRRSARPTSSSTSPRPRPRSRTSAPACEAGVHAVVGTTGFDLDELRAGRRVRSRRPTASSPPTSRSAPCC